MSNENSVLEARFASKSSLPIHLFSSDSLTNIYYNYEKIADIAKWIQERIKIKPVVAIICGSGLGGIADQVKDAQIIPYNDIPDFPKSTVEGHKGNLVFGLLNGLEVICMQGRFHPYEGYSVALCSMPCKLFKLLGVQAVILTNAAGGINKSFNVGDYMLIKDHFSMPALSLQHPLIGPNDNRFGPRFFPINNIYSKKLRDAFKQVGEELQVHVHEGVYAAIGGPTYETVTDTRFLEKMGVDSVGMSTAHEAIVSAYCGMKLLAFSIITDKVGTEFDAKETSDHEEICKVAQKKAKDAEKLLSKFLEKIKAEPSLLE